MKLSYYLLIIVLIISSLHLTGIFFGLYEKGLPIDMPQHILGGIFFGIIWLLILQKQNLTKKVSKSFIFFSILSFSVFGGFVWEVLEFSVWNLFPVFANNFKFYSSTVFDIMSDMISNFFGGIVIALLAIKNL